MGRSFRASAPPSRRGQVGKSHFPKRTAAFLMNILSKIPLDRNWVWSFADQGLILASAVFSVTFLIPRLGPAQYGAWAALFALLGPFSALAHAGVTLTILECIVRDDQDIFSVSRSCVTVALLLSGLMAPIVTVAGSFWIESVGFKLFALFVFSELLVAAVLHSIIAIVQGARSYPKAIALKLGLTSFRIAVLLLLVMFHSVSIENLVLANAMMLFLATLLGYLAASKLGLGPIVPGRIRLGHLRTAITYGLGIGSAIAQNDGDKVVLNAYGHHVDSGLYAVAYRLASILMMPLAAFLASSHFAVLQSSRNSSNQLRKALVFSAATAAYALPALGCLALAAPLVPRILGEEFYEASVIVQLVAPIAIIRFLGAFASNGLLGLRQNLLRTWILVASATLSLVLYVLLIPAYSWKGALVASLISEVALFVSCWIGLYICQRRANLLPQP